MFVESRLRDSYSRVEDEAKRGGWGHYVLAWSFGGALHDGVATWCGGLCPFPRGPPFWAPWLLELYIDLVGEPGGVLQWLPLHTCLGLCGFLYQSNLRQSLLLWVPSWYFHYDESPAMGREDFPTLVILAGRMLLLLFAICGYLVDVASHYWWVVVDFMCFGPR